MDGSGLCAAPAGVLFDWMVPGPADCNFGRMSATPASDTDSSTGESPATRYGPPKSAEFCLKDSRGVVHRKETRSSHDA